MGVQVVVARLNLNYPGLTMFSKSFEYSWGWMPDQPWYSIILLCVSIIAGSLSIYVYSTQYYWPHEKPRTTTGLVTKVTEGPTTLHVKYRDNTNKENSFTVSLAPDIDKIHQDDKVNVLYLPGENQKPKLEPTEGSAYLPIFYGGFSLGLLLFAAIFWYILPRS